MKREFQSPERELPKAPGLIGHLDLKGVQLCPDALFSYLEVFSRAGYEALLVEYEDIFPYQSVEVALHPEEVWSREFLLEFQSKAASLGLDIIPLQQSLGHLEYAFRWERYRRHSLSVGYPSTVHVKDENAVSWLKRMLIEMIEAHPQCRFIHLGMDEAYALLSYAGEQGTHPLILFLEHLDQLCEICEDYGKHPVIWADMLERHLDDETIEAVKAFRNRVSLISWHYHGPWRKATPRHSSVYFSGMKASRGWLDHARADEAPSDYNDAATAFETWPPAIAALAAPYRIGERWVKPYFPAAIWKNWGFRVWGGCGIVTSRDGAIVPLYHHRMSNIDTWAQACTEYRLDGLVVTAWARGDTYRPPNSLPDAIIPLIEYAAAKVGRASVVFAPGLPRERLWNLLWKLGRTQDDWFIYDSIISEMKELEETVSKGDTAWKRLDFLTRLLRASRYAEECLKDCEKRLACSRQIASEWERRLEEIKKHSEQLHSLRNESHALFSHYTGHAIEEWVTIVFRQPLERLARVGHLVSQKREAALCRFG